MLENRQKAEMRRRRQHRVPLDDCRVIISIAVRQPLNAPSDGSSSTLWYSCSVSSSDRPNCCRAVTSAFVSPSRGPPLSGIHQRQIKEFKGVNTHQYSYVHSVVQSLSRVVLQSLPLR